MRDRLCLLLGFLTLALVGGWTVVSLGLLLLGALAVPLGGRLPVPRPWLLPGALVTVLAVFAWPLERPAPGFVGVPSYKVALCAALFSLLAAWRRPAPSERLVALGLGVTLTMVCGMTTHREPYVWLAAAQVVGLALTLHPGPWRFSRWLSLLPVLALAGLTAWGLSWSETQLNEWMQNLNYGLNVATSFPHQTRLSALRSSQNSPLVIARVFSDAPPTHLVGRCYSRYRDSVWEGEPGRQTVAGGPPEWTYALATPASGPRVDRVELAATQGAALLIPRDAQALQLPCSSLVRQGGGTWALESSQSFPGSYQLERQPGLFLTQEAPDPVRELDLPPRLDPLVARLAGEQAGTGSATQRAGRLESWFHAHFQYGYGYPFDESRDPVAEFLTRRPPAHCELFATSLTLMLRSQGIPARYVVGFLVRERSPLGGYRVVRARDAHAWVEAWVDGRWVTLDPTPPQAVAPSGSTLEAVLERLVYYWGKLARDPWGALRWLLPRLVGGLGLLLCLWGLRRLPQRRRPARSATPRPDALGELLTRFERQVGGERPGPVPLWQWQHELSEPRQREFLRDYCRVRYGQAQASAEDLRRLEAWFTTE